MESDLVDADEDVGGASRPWSVRVPPDVWQMMDEYMTSTGCTRPRAFAVMMRAGHAAMTSPPPPPLDLSKVEQALVDLEKMVGDVRSTVAAPIEITGTVDTGWLGKRAVNLKITKIKAAKTKVQG